MITPPENEEFINWVNGTNAKRKDEYYQYRNDYIPNLVEWFTNNQYIDKNNKVRLLRHLKNVRTLKALNEIFSNSRRC